MSAFGALALIAGDVDAPGEYFITSGPAIVGNAADPFTVNAGYNGSSDTGLLDIASGGSLGVSDTV
ncbi:MAG: hypothetical protein HKN43_05940, partial [Rhodothermales bacterium]|nr:hypothetical protein [Rhodothermales bacterium]